MNLIGKYIVKTHIYTYIIFIFTYIYTYLFIYILIYIYLYIYIEYLVVFFFVSVCINYIRIVFVFCLIFNCNEKMRKRRGETWLNKPSSKKAKYDVNVGLSERGFTRSHGHRREFVSNGYACEYFKKQYWCYKYTNNQDKFIHLQRIYNALKYSKLVYSLDIPKEIIKILVMYSFGRIMICYKCNINSVDIIHTINPILMIEELRIKGNFKYFVCDDKILCITCFNSIKFKLVCNYCERICCDIDGYESQCNNCLQYCCDRDQNKGYTKTVKCGHCCHFAKNSSAYYMPLNLNNIDIMINTGMVTERFKIAFNNINVNNNTIENYGYNAYRFYKNGYNMWINNENDKIELRQNYIKYLESISLYLNNL